MAGRRGEPRPDRVGRKLPNRPGLHEAAEESRERARVALIEADEYERNVVGYSDELGQYIANRVANGEAIISICKDLGIQFYTLNAWRVKFETFSKMLVAARLAQADREFEEIRTIPDESTELANQSKVKNRMHARMFRVARMNRDLYSEKQGLTLTGNPEEPIGITNTPVDYSLLTQVEAEFLRSIARKLALRSEKRVELDDR